MHVFGTPMIVMASLETIAGFGLTRGHFARRPGSDVMSPVIGMALVSVSRNAGKWRNPCKLGILELFWVVARTEKGR